MKTDSHSTKQEAQAIKFTKYTFKISVWLPRKDRDLTFAWLRTRKIRVSSSKPEVTIFSVDLSFPIPFSRQPNGKEVKVGPGSLGRRVDLVESRNEINLISAGGRRFRAINHVFELWFNPNRKWEEKNKNFREPKRN